NTNTVNPTIMNSAIGSRGLLDPGASLMKLILKARLFNDLFSFQRLVFMPTNEQSSIVYVLLVRLLRCPNNKPCFPAVCLRSSSGTVLIPDRRIDAYRRGLVSICLLRE